MKLRLLPVKIDLPKEIAFWAAFLAFCFQTALRVADLALEVRFLGTAIDLIDRVQLIILTQIF